jgi:arabinofuranosyltransferase
MVAGLLALAWVNRFIQDDAFISFRYARNLATGVGLVWNRGEAVEGYTNFLWTILTAAGIRFGADPVPFAQVAGMVFFLCSLLLTYRLAAAAGLSPGNALVALLLTGTNFTFSSYATGGLETQMVTALFLAGCLVAVRAVAGRADRRDALLKLALLATVAILCRMDSALLLWGAGVGVILWSGGADAGAGTAGRPRAAWKDVAILLLLPLILLAPWCAWKLSYYGDLLPHAFYLKAVNASTLERGLRYFSAFIVSYNLFPFLFVCVFFFGRLFFRENRRLLLLAGVTVLWFSYILKIGGDFMEFRFMVPVIPLMMVLLVSGVLLVLGGSVHHALTFSYDQETGVEPVAMLEGHLTSPDENWEGIGKTLGRIFSGEDSVVIATTAAGAIPYYSGLRSVDMLGINSPQGARRGVFVGYIPGHQRVLPWSYLSEMGVNLVISHPVVSRVGSSRIELPMVPNDGPPHLNGTLIGIPIGEGYEVSALYIRGNPAVDSALARFGWPRRRVSF